MLNPARALAESSVPRYTSYPTAPQFSAAVNAGDYASWLSSLPRDATLSLYIHVPYCAELCRYCGCHTKAVRQRKPVEAYAERLIDEARLVGDRVAGGNVVHLHWGGGTPSMLGAGCLVRVFAAIAEVFDLSADHKHAIELDPRYVTGTLARALAGIGVNRASLGVQDFSADVQQAIGRVQPFESVRQAVLALRDAGIERINVDLMYGLPHQSIDDVRRSAALAVSLQPQRLAYFGYAHVPWLKPHQRLIEEKFLPDALLRMKQAQAGREALLDAGYDAIGLDHFARPDDALAEAARAGRLRRNFQGYTADQADALIGLGASAIGRLAQGFVQNAPDVAGYARAVSSGSLATVRGITLSPEDRLRSHIIERIMCDFALDLNELPANDMSGSDFDAELKAITPLAAEGLVHLDGKRIVVTDTGRPFVRIVASAFDAYRASSATRHSAAV
jgi:oxygen-independent coproporphyrinogen-3 oxidase